MHRARMLLAALLALGLVSCNDNNHPTAPTPPPAAPRGLYSVTGDQSVTLHWLANTEAGIVGYRVYESTCATTCPYDRIGTTTNTSFQVTGLTNGVTRFFAVAAVGPAGTESDLTYETIYDTPRPAGVGAAMVNVYRPGGTGWDFSAMLARPWTDPLVDVYFADSSGSAIIWAADPATNIQDAGYGATLDAVDYAPVSGWSPTGSAEAIVGHCYVVWTNDNHFAKFRVTGVTPVSGSNKGSVTFDWAYQTDPGNGELKAKPVTRGLAGPRQALVAQR